MGNVAKALWKSFQYTVASAGSAESITTDDIRTQEVYLQAPSSNTGTIALGDVDGQALIVPEQPLLLSDAFLNGVERNTFLQDLRINGSNNGDVINVLYSVVS